MILGAVAGRQLERPLNWQVVGLSVEWQDWLDSPILSIASLSSPAALRLRFCKPRQQDLDVS